jgi:hypothetical protein
MLFNAFFMSFIQTKFQKENLPPIEYFYGILQDNIVYEKKDLKGAAELRYE